MLAHLILVALAVICCVESMPAYFYRCYREADSEPIYERASAASYVPSINNGNGWHPVYPVQTRHTSHGCRCGTTTKTVPKTPIVSSRPAAAAAAVDSTVAVATAENTATSLAPQDPAKPTKVAEVSGPVAGVARPVAAAEAGEPEPTMNQVLRGILTFMKDIAERIQRVETKANAVGSSVKNSTDAAEPVVKAAVVAKSGAK